MTATVVAIFAIVYLGMIVDSIANIIVVDAACRRGIEIDWRHHARIGVPVTLATLAITAAWFGLRICRSVK
jgi:Na+/H+ antiporter NhaD/arsenite permease-like protein